MIIGSGLLARAFYHHFVFDGHVCVHAAGISNSACNDLDEFNRDEKRLKHSLSLYKDSDLFVYISTCSVFDTAAITSMYVQHKIKMESLASLHSRCLILRLPQVAGNTLNSHTLLNYLFTKINNREKFQVWKNAQRNIIDVEDVVRISNGLVRDNELINPYVNVASTFSVSMPELVKIMEKILEKEGICEYLDCGHSYSIDTAVIQPIAEKCGIKFDQNYTERIIRKYYERY